MTDHEAILRCQDGDREAFRYLVDRYKDVLFGTAVLMTGNRSVAEEQVQEALLSAWRGIRGFRLGSPVKPWLVRILVNAVLSQQRRRVLTDGAVGGRSGENEPGHGERRPGRQPWTRFGRPAGAAARHRESQPRPSAGGGAALLRRPDRPRGRPLAGHT